MEILNRLVEPAEIEKRQSALEAGVSMARIQTKRHFESRDRFGQLVEVLQNETTVVVQRCSVRLLLDQVVDGF